MGQCGIYDQPQEILDGIIDELADDATSLKTCSLVSRRLLPRSRKHLFKKVRFSSMSGSDSLRNWCAAMSPSGTPAAFTTSLRLSQREEMWMEPITLVRHFAHFQSFDRVESLTLSHFSCGAFDQSSLRFIFYNLILSVRKLCLHHPTARPDSLLQFISVFTKLQETMIRAPSWITSKQLFARTLAPSAFKGELRLCEFDRESGPFLVLLGSQTTRYEKVTLKSCRFENFHPLQRLISGTATTLRQLVVVAEGDHRKELPNVSLSNCTSLEYLTVHVVGPEASFRRINSTISSITSSRFRKFVLETNLREFPHIYSRVVEDDLTDRIGRLDRSLRTLAKNFARCSQGRFLFVLLAYNASKLAQKLTGLNGEGDIVIGEKIVGGDCACVHIPALTPLPQAAGDRKEAACNAYKFM